MELIRRRVIEVIDKAFIDKRIVFMIAPIGYGKTTAAKQYFEDKKYKYMNNTIYEDVVTVEDYEYFIERVRQNNGIAHMEWKGDTSRLGDFLVDKYTHALFDNVEHIKYKQLMMKRSDIYLQSKNVIKTLSLSRGRTFMKMDELFNKRIADIIDKTVLAFTKDEVIEYARINNIIVSNNDIRYALNELKGVPLFIMMYLNGGGSRNYKPYLSVYKSTYYDTFTAENQELLQVLAMFKSFTAQEIKDVFTNLELVDSIIELGYNYEGFIEYDAASGRYSLNGFMQELVISLLDKRVTNEYCKYIIDIKLNCRDYEQALYLTAKCGDRAQALELFNGDKYKLNHPTLYENFNAYIKQFSMEEKIKYPYAYLKFAYAELFNSSDEAIKQELMLYYNSLLSEDCDVEDKETIIQNCQLIIFLCGFYGSGELRAALTTRVSNAVKIKFIDIKQLFRSNYIMLSLRSYAPIARLKEFYDNNINEFQGYYGIPYDVFNLLYKAEYDIMTGNYLIAKEDLELIVAKADMTQNTELSIRARMMLGRASYYSKTTDKIGDYILYIERICQETATPKFVEIASSKYLKQFLGRLNGFYISLENIFHRRMLNNYGSYYLKWYIMKCFVVEKRYDELKIYLLLCIDKSSVSAVKADESLIMLYQSILHNCLGETKLAVSALIKCINLTALDGIVDILLDESKNIISTLAIIERNHLDEIRDLEYFNKIIALCQDFSLWQNVQSEKVLSERECEIIGHMAKGLKRKQIAEIMYLSPETIKKYMQSIYKKLGAGSYSEAVINATKLNLL